MRFKILTWNRYVRCKDEWEFEARDIIELRRMLEGRWGPGFTSGRFSIERIEGVAEKDANFTNGTAKNVRPLPVTATLLS